MATFQLFFQSRPAKYLPAPLYIYISKSALYVHEIKVPYLLQVKVTQTDIYYTPEK